MIEQDHDYSEEIEQNDKVTITITSYSNYSMKCLLTFQTMKILLFN